jgi:ABC-type phosphate/phosphonate transport system substrate-binding protein
VAAGQADIAAVDAVTWAILTDQGLAPDGLRVLDRTPPTPALPYIAAVGTDPAATRAALAEAVAALPAELARALHLRGIVAIPAERYLAVPTPPPPDRFP